MVILKEGEILAQGDIKSVFTKQNLDLAFDNVFHVIYRPEVNALQAFPG
jgi:ABC-type cobalamin/Fe3+-siderophores transport system ATPase subunit